VTVHLPVPETFTLANGLKVYLVEEKSLPILSVMMVTRAGSENNPGDDKAGLATLTAQIMGEATTKHDLSALAEAQERIGTRIGVNASMDSATTSMIVLTNHLKEGFGLFSEVVEHPAFSPDDLDRIKKQRLVALQQETDQVNAMASRVGPKLLYGNQPYAQSPSGTTASVNSITLDDVKSFYAMRYGPKLSALVLAGNVTTAEARKLAEEAFGSWSSTAEIEAAVPSDPKPPTTHVVIIDKPGAPQTALFAYGIGVAANSPDLQAIQVMNYTLGGAFASRINMNLREAHGYTYGASSQYVAYRAAGPFVAGGLVRTDITGPAAKELMYEIKRFPENPPTDEEIKMAKDARIQSLPGQFETTAAIAGSMGSIFIYNRPLDYYATLPAKYRAVTTADVARVAKEDIHPDQLIIVAAGDRAKIEPGLKEAGVGPIEIRDGQGNVVK